MVRNNLVYGNGVRSENGGGGIIITQGDNLIYNNICYGNGGGSNSTSWGISILNVPAGHGPNGVYHNVLFGNGQGGLAIQGSSNTFAEDNICASNAQYELFVMSSTGTILDYNCYYPDGWGRFMWDRASYNFASYKQATGQDAHGICQDPRFINAGEYDFHLRSDSPCKDAGTDAGIDIDFEGRPRPQGLGFDIGAYELQGTVADFSGLPRVGFPPLQVQFTDQTVGEVDTWQWDFGDSGTSSQQNPLHTYTSLGIYTVTLMASGASGTGQKTRERYVHVVSGADGVIIKNEGGASVASFTPAGDLLLKGTLTEQATPVPSGSAGELVVKGTSGSAVAVITAAGDMIIKGTAYELQDEPLFAPANAFAVKDDSGRIVSYIDKDGNLYLLGGVLEGAL